MTPATMYTIALDRVGLSSSATIFKDRARNYFNQTQDDIAQYARWTWLIGEETFNTVNGTKSYALSDNVLEPILFRDATNDVMLGIRNVETQDVLDPDEDETGLPRFIVPMGLSSNGNWLVDIYPTPDAVYTIGHRYYAALAPITSGSDDTDYDVNMPTWIQSAMIHGIAHRFYDEKGAHESAAIELRMYERILERALRRNALQGNRPTRIGRVSNLNRRFDFVPQEGTLA